MHLPARAHKRTAIAARAVCVSSSSSSSLHGIHDKASRCCSPLINPCVCVRLASTERATARVMQPCQRKGGSGATASTPPHRRNPRGSPGHHAKAVDVGRGRQALVHGHLRHKMQGVLLRVSRGRGLQSTAGLRRCSRRAHLWRHVKGRAGAKARHVRGVGVQSLRQAKVLRVQRSAPGLLVINTCKGPLGADPQGVSSEQLTASLTRIRGPPLPSSLSRMLPGVRSAVRST